MTRFYVPSIIEQHIHGGFGVNFNTCDVDDVLFFLEKIKDFGVSLVYPTLHTDELEVLNNQLKVIYEASKINTTVKIGGVHLEGPFINPEKAGVHTKSLIRKPNLNDYKKIVDGVDEKFVKIVTLAPELDENSELADYLIQNGVKLSAGHSLCTDLRKVNQVTHLFNAMGGINHKQKSTATEALINDDIYVEVIADGNHITDDVLKLIFKSKPKNKIMLISDALPVAHSKNETDTFMGQELYQKDGCARTKNGTLAGCAIFVFEIIKRLVKNGFLTVEEAFLMGSKNVADNLGLNFDEFSKNGHASMLEIDENFEIFGMD